MREDDIITLAKMLGAKKIRTTGGAVIMNCPLAPYLHDNGYDRKPSFGIFIDTISTYNCFACGMKGRLSYLPWTIYRLSGEYPETIARFISTNDYSPDVSKPNLVRFNSDELNKVLLPLYHTFSDLRPCMGLTEDDIAKWGLRFDPEKKAAVFPIFNNEGRLIGLKGRIIGTKEFFFYEETRIKRVGIWYGEHRKAKHKRLILCEGERDAILLSRYNIDVWASLGLPLTEAQMSRIKKSRNEFILFFDNDKAGQRTTKKIIQECKVFTPLYRVENYYGCKDPAEAVEKGRLIKCLRSIQKI
jgi:5S rRNA maturation endonuclease (ribonuclease M5)